MSTKQVTLRCDDGSTHDAIEWILSNTDPVLLNILENAAPELAGKVRIFDPKGTQRTEKQKIVRCFAGALSERLVLDYFRSIRPHDFAEFEIIAPKSDYARNQIDLIIRSERDPAISKTIEVRSSYAYKARTMDRLANVFSLLGPYTTSNKPVESSKDFYVTVVHKIDVSWIEKETGKKAIKIKSLESCGPIYKYLKQIGISSYFVGGDTSQAFLDSSTSLTDDLYQEGASYKTIYPICKGLDSREITERIVLSVK